MICLLKQLLVNEKNKIYVVVVGVCWKIIRELLELIIHCMCFFGHLLRDVLETMV